MRSQVWATRKTVTSRFCGPRTRPVTLRCCASPSRLTGCRRPCQHRGRVGGGGGQLVARAAAAARAADASAAAVRAAVGAGHVRSAKAAAKGMAVGRSNLNCHRQPHRGAGCLDLQGTLPAGLQPQWPPWRLHRGGAKAGAIVRPAAAAWAAPHSCRMPPTAAGAPASPWRLPGHVADASQRLAAPTRMWRLVGMLPRTSCARARMRPVESVLEAAAGSCLRGPSQASWVAASSWPPTRLPWGAHWWSATVSWGERGPPVTATSGTRAARSGGAQASR
mmetsp:Transcript_96020/g.266742  ORF Transcript_96020/g.266742 Transcript_96020/m.266742 type:complete len:278 (+) Transcript_96020:951-1784(+)